METGLIDELVSFNSLILGYFLVRRRRENPGGGWRPFGRRSLKKLRDDAARLASTGSARDASGEHERIFAIARRRSLPVIKRAGLDRCANDDHDLVMVDGVEAIGAHRNARVDVQELGLGAIGPARRAGPHAAVDRARHDAGRPWLRLVSEAGVPGYAALKRPLHSRIVASRRAALRRRGICGKRRMGTDLRRRRELTAASAPPKRLPKPPAGSRPRRPRAWAG
jgi:hypothetical protein